MATDIRIELGGITVDARLDDSPTAVALAATLPTTVQLSRWGEEYYGDCGIDAELAPDARDVLEVGELAYWPPGRALWLFFGPTPASIGDEPRAASAVNPIGRITGDATVLRGLPGSVSATLAVAE